MVIEGLSSSRSSRAAPEGANLSKIEAWFSRHFLLPVASSLISSSQALDLFQAEGCLIIRICEALTPEQMNKPVLIPRIRGIEEASRNWSPAMVVAHLVTVGRQICDTVIELTTGTKPGTDSTAKATEPGGGEGSDSVVAGYRAFVSDYVETLTPTISIAPSTATLEHPWFGDLDAQQWMVLGALHQRIRRRQLQCILNA